MWQFRESFSKCIVRLQVITYIIPYLNIKNHIISKANFTVEYRDFFLN